MGIGEEITKEESIEVISLRSLPSALYYYGKASAKSQNRPTITVMERTYSTYMYPSSSPRLLPCNSFITNFKFDLQHGTAFIVNIILFFRKEKRVIQQYL